MIPSTDVEISFTKQNDKNNNNNKKKHFCGFFFSFGTF